MKEVDRALKLDPTNTELLAQKTELLGKQVETAGEKLGVLKNVQEQVSQQFKNGDIGEEAYRAFQREVAIAEANAVKLEKELKDTENAMDAAAKGAEKLTDNIDGTGKSADDLTGSIDDAGKAMDDAAKDADELSDGIEDAGKSADDSGSSLQKLAAAAKRVSTAAAAALAAVGAAAAGAAKKIWDMSNEVAAAGDSIDKNSQKIGISAESYQEWSYVFERCGADVNGLGKGVKTLSKVILDAGNGAEGAQGKLAAVGLTVEELNGKSQDEQLSIVVAALQNMEAGAERAAAANDLLGESAQDMAAIFNTGAAETQALKDEAREYGMIMSNETVAASAAFADSLTRLKNTITGLKNSMIGELLPGISLIMDGFADLIAGGEKAGVKLEQGVQSLIKSIAGMVPKITEILSRASAAIMKSAPDILRALAQGILDALPGFSAVAAEIVTQIAADLIDLLPTTVSTLMDIIVRVVESLTAMLPSLTPKLTAALVQIIQALVNNLPLLLKAGLELVKGLVQGILDALPVLIDALPKLIRSIIDFLLKSIPEIIRTGVQLFTSLVQALPEIIKQIVDVLPEIISGIIDALLDNLPLIIKAGVELLTAIVSDVPTIINTIVAAVPQIINGIIEAFGELWGKMWEIGRHMIEGLWEGIKSMGSWLGDRCREFGDNWVSGFKTIFGIHSPSKLFRDEIGKNLALGLGEGFTDNMAKISRQMQEAVPTSFNAPEIRTSGINKAAPGLSEQAAAASQTIIFNLNVDKFTNHSEQDLDELMAYAGRYFADQMQRRSVVF